MCERTPEAEQRVIVIKSSPANHCIERTQISHLELFKGDMHVICQRSNEIRLIVIDSSAPTADGTIKFNMHALYARLNEQTGPFQGCTQSLCHDQPCVQLCSITDTIANICAIAHLLIFHTCYLWIEAFHSPGSESQYKRTQHQIVQSDPIPILLSLWFTGSVRSWNNHSSTRARKV